MKSLTVFLLVSLSISSNASFVSCFDQVEKDYYENARNARYTQLKSDYDFIATGEVVEFGRNVSFGPYEADKLAFHATGSIHSGWFHKVVIVDRITCEINEIQMVESE
ncbi:hypothetical protein A9Q84_13235 [Halobacteriovorax marinus]|uniref:Lipoprotein n=1 Tax=Halobacteriovorax marinus TaxID=97084 RepID=A0A1Y5F916_9BACT|nr:hypothetical protein A9Q84_13235 [Halobacteriovorax marinus]